jgi:hypothetical protein
LVPPIGLDSGRAGVVGYGQAQVGDAECGFRFEVVGGEADDVQAVVLAGHGIEVAAAEFQIAVRAGGSVDGRDGDAGQELVQLGEGCRCAVEGFHGGRRVEFG